jgi:hypothetical protein
VPRKYWGKELREIEVHVVIFGTMVFIKKKKKKIQLNMHSLKTRVNSVLCNLLVLKLIRNNIKSNHY